MHLLIKVIYIYEESGDVETHYPEIAIIKFIDTSIHVCIYTRVTYICVHMLTLLHTYFTNEVILQVLSFICFLLF